MKTKNLVKAFCLTLVMGFTMYLFSSCQSREEKVISNMESICEEAEKEDLDTDDFEDIEKEYEDLVKDASDCDFTQEQMEELGKLHGRFAAAAAKHAGNMLEEGVNSLMNFGKGFAEGLEDAAEE